MKHKILIFLLIVISMTCAAQNERVVKGVVRSEKGTPVSGAVVSAHEAELSVRTGSDGAFVITLPDNVEKLQAACSGYHTIVLDARRAYEHRTIYKPSQFDKVNRLIVFCLFNFANGSYDKEFF